MYMCMYMYTLHPHPERRLLPRILPPSGGRQGCQEAREQALFARGGNRDSLFRQNQVLLCSFYVVSLVVCLLQAKATGGDGHVGWQRACRVAGGVARGRG